VEPILKVVDLHKTFSVGGTVVGALHGVSFELQTGEAIGLVGESGCGKTTLARCILRLTEPDSGEIYFKGQRISGQPERAFRRTRQKLQMVFQDPVMSLNPRLTVEQTISEPLRLHGLARGAELRERLHDTLSLVGLEREHLGKRPHQLSGGQKQRVGIARAIATNPECVLLDEPTSSLDMSVRSHIVQLLKRLREELGVAYIFISHDLSTVRFLCSRILVMYQGQIIEAGEIEETYSRPRHPYTKALLSAIPVPEPGMGRERIRLTGEVASIKVERGCILRPRCPFAVGRCAEEDQPLRRLENGHLAACWRAEELAHVETAKLVNGSRP
jgi:oligopeptide/dipeptide ABC transporter ATP-binding protein